MSALYKILTDLCEAKGISGYKMCKDNGMQPSVMTDLRKGRRSGVSAETANRLAQYFGVSVNYILTGEEKENALSPTKKDEREVADDDIKFALFGTREIDDAVLDQVKAFAKFARENRKDK